MKLLPTIAGLAAFGFLLGCNRSDSERTATDSRDATMTASRADMPNPNNATNLTPTSRNIDAASRVYPNDPSTASKDVDNTANNARDKGDVTLTPGDQGNSEADREVTRNIRRALTKNDQLST